MKRKDEINREQQKQENFDHQQHPNIIMNQLRLFIAGDKSHCGKSSICLSLIAMIRDQVLLQRQQQEVQPEVDDKKSLVAPIGYIKPCTQCIDTQPVWKYCYSHKLPFTGMGPIIYYNGYTSEVQREQSPELMPSIDMVRESENSRIKKVVESVEALRSEWVIVDGIGYASVGSVIGCSNARVAHELSAPVLLIINFESGSLGNAIDLFNLNCLYMEYFDLQEQQRMIIADHDSSFRRRRRVIGVIFNKVPQDLYEQRKKDVEIYFAQHVRSDIKVYGFIPMEHGLVEHQDVTCVKQTCMSIAMSRNDPMIENQSAKKHELLQMNSEDEAKVDKLLKVFSRYIDVQQIMKDVQEFN